MCPNGPYMYTVHPELPSPLLVSHTFAYEAPVGSYYLASFLLPTLGLRYVIPRQQTTILGLSPTRASTLYM